MNSSMCNIKEICDDIWVIILCDYLDSATDYICIGRSCKFFYNLTILEVSWRWRRNGNTLSHNKKINKFFEDRARNLCASIPPSYEIDKEDNWYLFYLDLVKFIIDNKYIDYNQEYVDQATNIFFTKEESNNEDGNNSDNENEDNNDADESEDSNDNSNSDDDTDKEEQEEDADDIFGGAILPSLLAACRYDCVLVFKMLLSDDYRVFFEDTEYDENCGNYGVNYQWENPKTEETITPLSCVWKCESRKIWQYLLTCDDLNVFDNCNYKALISNETILVELLNECEITSDQICMMIKYALKGKHSNCIVENIKNLTVLIKLKCVKKAIAITRKNDNKCGNNNNTNSINNNSNNNKFDFEFNCFKWFWIAACEGCSELIDYFLKFLGKQCINRICHIECDDSYCTPLWIACFNGHSVIVKKLLSLGGNVDICGDIKVDDNLMYGTCVDIAVLQSHWDVAEVLLPYKESDTFSDKIQEKIKQADAKNFENLPQLMNLFQRLLCGTDDNTSNNSKILTQ